MIQLLTNHKHIIHKVAIANKPQIKVLRPYIKKLTSQRMLGQMVLNYRKRK